MQMLTEAHAREVEQVELDLRTDASAGLTEAEAHARLDSIGPNELAPAQRTPLVVRFLNGLREPMALLLIVAAVVSGVVLGERAEAIAIVAIVLLNAVIALLQESKAERSLAALKQLESPSALVIRNGEHVSIPTREIVPGDLIRIREGDRVPADARLLTGHEIEVDESTLTGESLPVHKSGAEVFEPETAMADRHNLVFGGTLVTSGVAHAIVIATGPSSVIGMLAEQLAEPKADTPLQDELAHLTKRLGAMAILAASVAFIISLIAEGFSVEALDRTFLAAVALAVAAVPEGLATVVTVALALGVARMADQGAIVRRLPAVETLGATTVIATDKTGTITQNRLRVIDVWGQDTEAIEEVAAVCNDATLQPLTGDPVDVALLEWVGIEKCLGLRAAHEVVTKVPFDAGRRFMAVSVSGSGGDLTFVKGAPEAVLSLIDPGPQIAVEVDRRCSEMAQRGLKVLAFARGTGAFGPGSELEQPQLLGLIALGDPVRPEARDAVSDARSAGVRLIMVTGDHPETARTIAAEAGLEYRTIIRGQDLVAGMPGDPGSFDIYARTAPEQKLALVEALQEAGEVVAVTGDGVNDAPALHRADIGVAMGRSGTDVAKEAADLVITDDNLATVVTAIREGRGIYDNIRKVIDYLVAANISEVMVVITALILFPGLGVPLLPLQLLWINLITDGLPAIALGLDPVSPGVMKRPPRSKGSMLSSEHMKKLAARGAILATSALAVLSVSRFIWDESWAHARATMFITLACAQLAYAFGVRLRPPGRGGPLLRHLGRNRLLWAAAVGGVLLQVGMVTWEPARELLDAAVLSWQEWGLVAAGAILPTLAIVLRMPFGHSGASRDF